jgi:hypothetical protein
MLRPPAWATNARAIAMPTRLTAIDMPVQITWEIRCERGPTVMPQVIRKVQMPLPRWNPYATTPTM